jgi:hypothetical protein
VCGAAGLCSSRRPWREPVGILPPPPAALLTHPNQLLLVGRARRRRLAVQEGAGAPREPAREQPINQVGSAKEWPPADGANDESAHGAAVRSLGPADFWPAQLVAGGGGRPLIRFGSWRAMRPAGGSVSSHSSATTTLPAFYASRHGLSIRIFAFACRRRRLRRPAGSQTNAPGALAAGPGWGAHRQAQPRPC